MAKNEWYIGIEYTNISYSWKHKLAARNITMIRLLQKKWNWNRTVSITSPIVIDNMDKMKWNIRNIESNGVNGIRYCNPNR